MELTDQQLAHVLAALRATQDKGLGAMPHFEDAGPPLTSEEVEEARQSCIKVLVAVAAVLRG